MGGGRMTTSSSFSAIQQSDTSIAEPSPSSSWLAYEPLLDASAAIDADLHRKTFAALMESYCASHLPSRQSLDEAKLAILRHKPGDWIEKVGGLAADCYEIPETTALLLIGLRGSGKSSLVNRITRVFEDNPSAPDRAQISYAGATEGTCFLQEYPIPRNSGTLCVYDTRSLSQLQSDNFELLESWMSEGVSHGEMAFMISDDALTRIDMRVKARQVCGYSCKKRMVNFVILVANGLSILKSLENKDTQYIDMIDQTLNSPYVSFRDNKPVVVITHGDELSFHDRAFVRTNLGERLGIPPSTQIFDIPDNMDYATEVAIVEMLRFCIEHADRNLPHKATYLIKARTTLKRMGSNFPKLDRADALIEMTTIFVCICFLVRLLGMSMTWMKCH